MIWLAMVPLLISCASVWQPAPPVLEARHWSLEAPDGWMRLTTASYEMLSIDGPYLQYIFIQQQPLAQGLRHTRRKMDHGMLPHETAQVVEDALASDPQIRNFRLLSSQPAFVGEVPGFRLVYAYTDNQGVDTKSIYYGAVVADTFFNIRYTAAQRHYYTKHLSDFEQVVGSLRFF